MHTGHPIRKRTAAAAAFGVRLLVCALLPASAGGCRLRTPEIELHGIALESVSLKKANVILRFRVTNPNGFDLKVRSLESDLFVAGVPFVHGIARQPIPTCRANSSIVVAAEAVLEYEKLLAVLREGPRLLGLPYEVKGTAVFDLLGFAVPARITGDGRLALHRRAKLKNIKIRLLRGPSPVGGPGSLAAPRRVAASWPRAGGDYPEIREGRQREHR